MLLITGATGNVGGEIVRSLNAAGRAPRIYVRDPAKAARLSPGAKYEAVSGDFADLAAFRRALEGVEALFLVTTEDDAFIEGLADLMAAVRGAGVRRCVVLSATADMDSSVDFIRRHGEIERRIRQSGVEHTFLHPDWFMQNFDHFAAAGAINFPAGAGKTSFVDVRDVADLAIRCLIEPHHVGLTYSPTGPRAISFAEAALILSRSLGRLISYRDVPADQFAAGLIRAGLPAWRAQMQAGMTLGLRLGLISEPSQDVRFVLGRPPRSFEAYAASLAGVADPVF